MKKAIIASACSIFLAGCAAQYVVYHSTSTMSARDASATLRELNKKCFHGEIVGLADDSIEYDEKGRFYFESVEKVSIYAKGGFFEVYVSGKENSGYVCTMEEKRDAEKYVDALESLIYAYRTTHKEPAKASDADANAAEERLHKLESLKARGAITEAEYQQKRKEILDSL